MAFSASQTFFPAFLKLPACAIPRLLAQANLRLLKAESFLCRLLKSPFFVEVLQKAGLIGSYTSSELNDLAARMWESALGSLMV